MTVKEILKECKVKKNGELVDVEVSNSEAKMMQNMVDLAVHEIKESLDMSNDDDREYLELSKNALSLQIIENFFKLRNK